MPKTNKNFDWEIYDLDGDFVDIMSMTRSEAKIFSQNHPEYTIQELGYSDDGGDDTRENSSKEGGNIYSVCIPVGKRRIKNVH